MGKKAISNTFTVNIIDDAVTYGFVFTEAFAKADASKTITANIKGYAYKYAGDTRTPLANTIIRYGYIIDDRNTYADTTTDSSGFFDTDNWFNGDNIDDYAKGSPSIFAAIQIGGVIVHVEYITISLQGANGQSIRGKVGRFYYYSGFDWNASNNTDTFVVNDAQVPYFSKAGSNGDKYYVFNPETTPASGSMTMAQMWAISSNWDNKPWEVMTDDFKYLITEAIFGKYAHFGSFIINEDWMLSQYGELVQPSGNIITVNASNVNTKYSGNSPVVLNGNHVNNGIIVYKVSFNVSSATTINITLTTSSENNYDFGAVGKVDNDSLLSATASSIKSDSGSVTSLKTSGSSTVSTSISLNAGSHYLYIGYFKDGSSNVGNDNASFSISGADYNLTEAKKTSGMSMSGGPMSVVPYGWFDPTDPEVKTLPTSGYKFRPAFAVDGLTGETYQQSAHIKGTVTATSGSFTNGTFTNATISSGSIGGFTIDTNRLYNSNWNAGIDINYDSKTVKIGKNAQGVMNTEDAIIRAENTKTLGGLYNTALYLNASGATYNYAFYGNGNGVLNGLVFGYKVQLYTIPSGSVGTISYLNIIGGSTIILNGSHDSGIVSLAAPKLTDVRNCLGINNSTTPFAIEFTVISHATYGDVCIIFRTANTGIQDDKYLPWLMNENDIHMMNDAANIQISQGDVVKILLVYDNVGTTSSTNYEYRAYDLIRRV